MKLVINAINLSSAGGLSVAINFLATLSELNLDGKKIYIFAPKNKGYLKFQNDSIKVIEIPDYLRKAIYRYYTDNYWLVKQIKELEPDVIFTMGNFALPIKNVKQALLFHWPYAIYPEDKEIWSRMSLKDYLNRKTRYLLFKYRLKFVDTIFPQTRTAKKRLEKYYHPQLRNKNIVVIPNAYTTIDLDKEISQCFFKIEKGTKYLFCLSRYYPHKNIEILLEVAKIIKERQLNYKIIVTASEDQHPKVAIFNKLIITEGLEDILINIGQVPFNVVPDLYKSIDALILPTLLESFSGTYVDAMHFSKTVFTSRRDFADEVCGDAAFYFNPLDPVDILRVINDAFADEEVLKGKIEKGLKRVENFPNWTEVTGMYIDNLNKIYRN